MHTQMAKDLLEILHEAKQPIPPELRVRYCVQYTVYTTYNILCILHTIYCVYFVQYTVYTSHNILCILHTIYCVYFAQYTVYTSYNILCMLHIYSTYTVKHIHCIYNRAYTVKHMQYIYNRAYTV